MCLKCNVLLSIVEPVYVLLNVSNSSGKQLENKYNIVNKYYCSWMKCISEF